MLTRFFDNTRPITILFLFLTLLIISSSSVLYYFSDTDFHNNYHIGKYFRSLGNVAISVLSVLLIISLGFLVNYLVHENSITRNNSFALLFFVVLVTSHPALSIINPVLVSTFFVVMALKSLLSLHEHTNMTQKLFNAGFLIGIASIIYPYSLLYSILIFLGIIIYGADSWRQWFIPVLGVLLPYYLLFAWFFWFDGLDLYWDTFFIHSFDIGESIFHNSPKTLAVWGVFSLLTILSILDYTRNMNQHKLDTRKGYSMTYLALFIGVVISFFGTINNGQELIILFLPISIIWAKFIQHQKKERWRTIFILIVIITSAASFFYK